MKRRLEWAEDWGKKLTRLRLASARQETEMGQGGEWLELKRGLVTIAGKPSDELAPGTKNSILKQAALK